MPQVTAQLNDYRQSPRKVRLVARDIAGKKVSDILPKLEFLAKRSATPLFKLVSSAVANATNRSIDTDNLYIKELRVDNGAILYRRRSASRGRAPQIRKRTSHIKLVLETREAKAPKAAKKAKKLQAN